VDRRGVPTPIGVAIDAALARSPDGNGLSAQFRIVALFDGSVERIHVDMDNLALPCWTGIAGTRGLVERFCSVIGVRINLASQIFPGEEFAFCSWRFESDMLSHAVDLTV
jgi:hypothetical protein